MFESALASALQVGCNDGAQPDMQIKHACEKSPARQAILLSHEGVTRAEHLTADVCDRLPEP
eukprot:20450-Alexandrium_andersonii.AAC.1